MLSYTLWRIWEVISVSCDENQGNIVEANPLENLQVLYGTGAIKLNEKNEVIRVGGVKYTVKDGVVYDSKKLLADVRKMVKESKGGKELKQPGVKDPDSN